MPLSRQKDMLDEFRIEFKIYNDILLNLRDCVMSPCLQQILTTGLPSATTERPRNLNTEATIQRCPKSKL